MTVKDLMDKLKVVKNKETELVFKSGKYILPVEFLSEVIKDGDKVRYPQLGEETNAVVCKLADIPETPSAKPASE